MLILYTEMPTQVSAGLDAVYPTKPCLEGCDLVMHSEEVMYSILGLPDERVLERPRTSQVFGGNVMLADPALALVFRHDTDAVCLGQLKSTDGLFWEVQVKGIGPTPQYAGDVQSGGRLDLVTQCRRALSLEYMNKLGIPSPRAGCIVLGRQSEFYR